MSRWRASRLRCPPALLAPCWARCPLRPLLHLHMVAGRGGAGRPPPRPGPHVLGEACLPSPCPQGSNSTALRLRAQSRAGRGAQGLGGFSSALDTTARGPSPQSSGPAYPSQMQAGEGTGLLCGASARLFSGAVPASKPWRYESTAQAQGPQAVCSRLKTRPSLWLRGQASSQVSKTPQVWRHRGPSRAGSPWGSSRVEGSVSRTRAQAHRCRPCR